LAFRHAAAYAISADILPYFITLAAVLFRRAITLPADISRAAIFAIISLLPLLIDISIHFADTTLRHFLLFADAIAAVFAFS